MVKRAAALGVCSAMTFTACGSGDDGPSAGGEPTSSTPSTTTTTGSEPTLTAEAQRAVIICVEAQSDYAGTLSVGLEDDSEKNAVDDKCTEAQAFIDTEAPNGDNAPNAIAVLIAENNYELSSWALNVTLNGEAGVSASGTDPTAALGWGSELDDLLAQLPDP